MNFGLAFSFGFKDPDWIKKVIIAALISLIPIIGQLYLLGWGLSVTRSVIAGDNSPLLPETDFGKHLGTGFKAFVIGFVYSIPIYIIMLPIIITDSVLPGTNMDQNTLATIMSLVSLCCGSLIFLYAILVNFLLAAGLGNFMANDSLGAGLRFGEVFGLVRAAPAAYLVTLLGVIVAGFVASLGSIACGIGVLLTSAYAMVIMGHFYGQAYNQARAMRAAKGI